MKINLNEIEAANRKWATTTNIERVAEEKKPKLINELRIRCATSEDVRMCAMWSRYLLLQLNSESTVAICIYQWNWNNAHQADSTQRSLSVLLVSRQFFYRSCWKCLNGKWLTLPFASQWLNFKAVSRHWFHLFIAVPRPSVVRHFTNSPNEPVFDNPILCFELVSVDAVAGCHHSVRLSGWHYENLIY